MKNTLFRKVRSDASWKKLPLSAQARLEAWLFEDNLSYAAAVARAKTELGFVTSIWALKRFHDRKLEERFVLGDRKGEDADWRESATKMISRAFVSRLESEQGTDLETLAKWVSWAEANELRRRRVEIEGEWLRMEQTRLEASGRSGGVGS